MRILILEHDQYDLELLQYELKKSHLEYTCEIVDLQVDYENSIRNFKPDIILSDYSLPTFTGLEAFDIKKNLAPDTPFIIVSGTLGEEKAVDLIKRGITDYVLKGNLYQVVPKIHRAMQEVKDKKEKLLAYQKLRDSEAKYREVFQLSPLPMWIFDMDTFAFLEVNEAACRNYGYSEEEFLALTTKDIRPEEDVKLYEDAVKALGYEGLFYPNVYRHIKKDGTLIKVNIQSSVIDYEGRKVRLVLATDITDRLTYIEAIEAQNQKLHDISWIQSHYVQTPISRILGVVDSLRELNPDSKILEMIQHIENSTIELDDVVRDVVNKTAKINL